MVCALPPDFSSRFGEICWAQGGVGFGWWPCCIYDPRLTVGQPRNEARKYLGKKHLVYFFECYGSPFAIVNNKKIISWEEGVSDDFHIGRAARNHGKLRFGMFQHALQAATIEESKPIFQRLDSHQTAANPLTFLPSPVKQTSPVKKIKKKERDRKRSRSRGKDPLQLESEPEKKRSAITIAAVTAPAPTPAEKPVGKTQKPVAKAQKPVAKANLNVAFGAAAVEGKGKPAAVAPARANPAAVASARANPTAVASARAKSAAVAPARANPVVRARANPAAGSTRANIGAIPPVRANPAAIAPARANPVAIAPALFNPAAIAPAPVASNHVVETEETKMVCKIIKKGQDGEEDKSIGFFILNSRKKSFLDARHAMVDQGLPINMDYRFSVPILGPISVKQESSLGPMLPFLESCTPNIADVGDGSFANPVKVFLAGAPVL
jgi:hypothetical protein